MNSNSAAATSSKEHVAVEVGVTTVSHTEHCEEADNLDALRGSAKHHAESVPSEAASSSRDKATTVPGKKPIPGLASKCDAFSAEDDLVRTSLKHIGLIIEVCAGSAMLSRCFSECGFDVMPIDHSQNRFHPLAKICNLSLTEQASWDYLFWLVSTFLVAFCHFAPPCGTSSRARELDNGPPPLRNEAFAWGFPDSSTRDKARVDSANFINSNMAAFIEKLIQKGILFSVENPANSLLWEIPIWETILKYAFFVVFDACCYGGKRKTAKCFLTNVEPMKAMSQRCPGGHQHLPYGRVKLGPGKYAYATAEEAAYP